MAFPVTINGRTYTLADFEGLNYVSGFPDALEDFATDAGAAATNATNAAASATAAAASATSAQAALDAIEGFYLGGQASDPTVDLNGDPLTAGDWYFNTSSNSVKIYDGSSFVTLTGVTFDLVDDTTPQLGGNLDLNGNDISGVNATELAVLDGASSNTVVNSKAVIYGSAGEVTASQVDITGQGDLRLQDSTGGEYVGLQAPATVGSSFTLTLPTADGTADQVLSTNGSGALSFADAGGGSWTLLNTYTPSAASTVDMEDFSSTYDVYKIIYRVKNTGTANEILMYLKIGGSYKTAGYDWMNIISSATDGGTYVAERNTNTSEIRIYQSNSIPSNTLTYGEITFPFVNTSGRQVINWDTTTQAPFGEPMRAIGGIGGYMDGNGTITGARFQFANSATATGTFWVYALTAST